MEHMTSLSRAFESCPRVDTERGTGRNRTPRGIYRSHVFCGRQYTCHVRSDLDGGGAKPSSIMFATNPNSARVQIASVTFKIRQGHPPGQLRLFSLLPPLVMGSSQQTQLRMTLTVSTVANAFIKFKRARYDALEFASGMPITHPPLCGQDATCERRVPVGHADRYVCTGAVDVAKLLRGSRASLLEKAVFLGANVLVEERSVSTFSIHPGLSLCPRCFVTVDLFWHWH